MDVTSSGSGPTRRSLGVLLGALLAMLAGTATAAERVVVATFSVLGDIAREVAGERVEVRVLAPVGAEVHEWELTARNFVDLEEADLVLANGYMLEQWMPQLEEVAGATPVVRVAEATGYPTIPIRVGDLEGVPDPHLWMHPDAAAAYARVIAERMAELDPGHADAFRADAERFAAELGALTLELHDRLSAVPPERRLLVTSEAAFHYFADAFGFEHHGIWGSNAEEEGTPEQLMRIIDIVQARRPAALFFESTITDRYVQSVAEDTGAAVAGPLFVDSLGPDGTGAETYAGMLRTNVTLIAETLLTQ
jgi:manganese/iron transport system substrate-binding protein